MGRGWGGVMKDNLRLVGGGVSEVQGATPS